jgi:V-type H+-transporting ATPase subunit d
MLWVALLGAISPVDSYSYMIDNAMLLISGTLHHRERQELLDKCHPLGLFDGMAALTTANTPVDLYNIILVATPLGQTSFRPVL